MVAAAGMGSLLSAVNGLTQRMGAMTGALRRIQSASSQTSRNTSRQTNILRSLQSISRAGTARTVNAISRLSGVLSRGLGSISTMFQALWKSQAAQKSREMLGRIGGGIGRGLAAPIREVYKTLQKPLNSMLSWGGLIAGAFWVFMNSPLWDKFKAYLVESLKEGGWLYNTIKFFEDVAKMDFEEIKNKITNAVYDFGNIFVDMMNSMIEVYNKMAALPLVPLEPKEPLERFERDDPAFKNMDIESGGVERVSAEASPEAAEEVSKNFDTKVDEKLTNLEKSEQAAHNAAVQRRKDTGDILGTPYGNVGLNFAKEYIDPFGAVDWAVDAVGKILPDREAPQKIKEIKEVRGMSDEEFKKTYSDTTNMNKQEFIIKLLNELKDNLIIRRKDSAEEIVDLKKQIEDGAFNIDTGLSIKDEKLELKSEKERMNQLNQAIKEVTNLREELTSNKSANLKSPSGGMPPQPPAPSRGGSNGNYPVAPKNLRPNYMQQLARQSP